MPKKTNNALPVALTIAGSDCSGGAGIQADLKTFQHFKVHGLSAVTSIVAETPLEVRQLAPVEIPLLQDQLNILHETYPVDAVKTGLLPSRMSVIAIVEIFKDSNIPLVVDPVMIASTGAALTGDDTASTLTSRLLPIATLVTPNIPEAETMLARSIETPGDLEQAAKDIAEKHNIACLLKGGHLPGNDDRIDVLYHDGKIRHFQHPCIGLPEGIHGTGCTLSSAITAGIAQGNSLEQAVENGIAYVQQLLANPHCWQQGDNTIRCLGW